MLSDPISVTVDSSARSMPRIGAGSSGSAPRTVARNVYSTADGAYSVATQQSEYRDGSRRVEIILRKAVTDSDSGDFYLGTVRTGVGLTYELNPYGKSSAAEIANLRAALLTFVDSTLEGRLRNGEA